MYRRRNRLNSRKSKLFQWVVFSALLVYLLITLYNQQDLLDNKKAQYEQSVSILNAEKEKSIQLQRDYATIGTQEFYERIARRYFGYIAPNETVYYESKK